MFGKKGKYNENNVALSFDEVANANQARIRELIQGKNIVYIYHNQVDARGDKPAIVKNAEQLFDEKNVEDNLIKRILKIGEHDFLEKNIDRLFPGVYAIVDKAIKEQNIEIINIKCYTYIKIMKLLIATILYRNKKIYQSLYLILITAMFYADKYKLDKVGFKDKAIDEIVSFPSFEDVILHSDECEEMEYCDLAINEVNKKGKKLFDIVKRGTLTGEIERITQDLSSVYDEYLVNNLEIKVVDSTIHGR